MTQHTCRYCGDHMSNLKRVQCGKPECKRLHHNARCRPYVNARRAKQRAAGTYKHWTCMATCVVCGAGFESTKSGAKYCSTGKGSCEAKARSVEYKRRGTSISPWHEQHAERAQAKRDAAVLTSVTAEPTRNDIAAYRRALKHDPCAYCGSPPPVGIDHIEPASIHGDRSDWTNLIGCCKRCNETKRDLPLMLALPWIPISRQYHDARRMIFQKAA